MWGPTRRDSRRPRRYIRAGSRPALRFPCASARPSRLDRAIGARYGPSVGVVTGRAGAHAQNDANENAQPDRASHVVTEKLTSVSERKPGFSVAGKTARPPSERSGPSLPFPVILGLDPRIRRGSGCAPPVRQCGGTSAPRVKPEGDGALCRVPTQKRPPDVSGGRSVTRLFWLA